MSNEHIVKSFAQELQRLSNQITQMGGVADAQVEAAVQALVRRDTTIAAQVIQSDLRIDTYEREIDNETLRLLALRQPMASDLREIVSALKIAADIERIGDHATNIAETIHFLVIGHPLTTERQKGDESSFAVVTPQPELQG